MVRFPIIVVAMLAALPTATGFAQTTACESYQVNAQGLNLRSAPSIAGEIVGVLRDRQIVCIGGIEDTNGQQWGNVTRRAEPDGSAPETISGWSNMRYLTAVTLPPSAETDTAETGSAVAGETPDAAPDTGVTPHIDAVAVAYGDVIEVGPYPVRGRSLEQLANGIPLFPPIEGLPEDRWKNQCTTCHQWDRDRLCVQGKSYADDPVSAFRIQHPYGSPFKKALGAWAAGGCP